MYIILLKGCNIEKFMIIIIIICIDIAVQFTSIHSSEGILIDIY